MMSPQNSRCKLVKAVMRTFVDALNLRHAALMPRGSSINHDARFVLNLTGKDRPCFELWEGQGWKLQPDPQNHESHRKPLGRPSCEGSLRQSCWLPALRLRWVVSCAAYWSHTVMFSSDSNFAFFRFKPRIPARPVSWTNSREYLRVITFPMKKISAVCKAPQLKSTRRLTK